MYQTNPLPRFRTARRASGGFTLIELLVVISIIALLIGILLPALGAARDTARDAQCLSNIRQIAIANYGYAADNDGHVVPAATPSPGADPDDYIDVTRYWTSIMVIDGYGMTRQFFRCPRFEDERTLPDNQSVLEAPLTNGGSNFWWNVDYAVNARVAADRPTTWGPRDYTKPARIEYVKQPADTIYAIDSFYMNYDPQSPTYSGSGLQRGFFALFGLPTIGENPHARHNGTAINIAYADGHGAAFAVEDKYAPHDTLGIFSTTVKNPWDRD